MKLSFSILLNLSLMFIFYRSGDCTPKKDEHKDIFPRRNRHKNRHQKPTTTTTTTTTKTTEEPESEASKQIQRMYEFGQQITDNAYSFTIEEAFANTPNRSMSFIAPDFPSCNRTIPKRLEQKINEVQKLIDRSGCDNGLNAMLKSPKKSSKSKHRHFRHHNVLHRRPSRRLHHLLFRHRREASMCLEIVPNVDGSESCIVECTEKGAVVNGVLQTCTECLVYTTLPSDV